MPDHHTGDEHTGDERDRQEAEELVEEAESRGEDPETIREVIEGELEEEGLSEEGGHLGQHID